MFNWIIHIFDKKVFLYNWKFWTLFILVLVIFLTFINLVQRNFKFFSILISSMIIVYVLHIQIILITIMLISEILILCETVLFEISLQLVTINMMKMHSTRFLRREVISAIVLFLNILFYTFWHCMCYIYIPSALLFTSIQLEGMPYRALYRCWLLICFSGFVIMRDPLTGEGSLPSLVVSVLLVCLSWISVSHLRWLEKSGIWH